MSMKSWKEEFYPTESSEEANAASNEAAIKHSLQKWRGLRVENLEKHDLVIVCGPTTIPSIEDAVAPFERFKVNGNSCSLCNMSGWMAKCRECPLSKVRAGHPCDEKCSLDENPTFPTNSVRDPWRVWTYDTNPEPMIYWLEKALEKEQNENH